ncbi:MAG TPA: diguanylate cyclase [Trichocoleus sp.]
MSAEQNRILIVDDQPDNLEILSFILDDHGYQVRQATSGPIALDMARDYPPDLVLLDIMMPGMNGFQVCAAFKADAAISDIPIIFLSALDRSEDKAKAFNIGGTDYITKPFDSAEVLVRVGHQITIRRQRQQLVQQNQQLQKEIEIRKQAEIQLKLTIQRDRIFSHITQHIRRSLHVTTVLQTTADELRQALEADRVLILKLPSPHNLEFMAESIREPPLAIHYGMAEGLDCLEFQNLGSNIRQTSLLYDVRELRMTEECHTLLEQLHIRASLTVPIFQREEPWGLLMVHQSDKPRRWQPWEVKLVEQVAGQLAIALQQADLYHRLERANEKLRWLATIDGLTEVFNRRYFDYYLRHEWRRLLRDQQPLSLLLCDIDYFKAYNDYYGHPAGDACLKQIASALRSSTRRPADLVARYGGEEFAVILPNTNLTGAQQIAEQIQAEVAAQQIPHNSSLISDCVTISIGVTTHVPTRTDKPEHLITAADAGLYLAKEKGRNQYQVKLLSEYRQKGHQGEDDPK